MKKILLSIVVAITIVATTNTIRVAYADEQALSLGVTQSESNDIEMVKSAPAAPTDIVTFADPDMYEAVRVNSGLPTGSNITVADMEALTSLIIPNTYICSLDCTAGVDEYITSFEGLQYATNLETLDVAGHIDGSTDMSAISSLTKLVEVRFTTIDFSSTGGANLEDLPVPVDTIVMSYCEGLVDLTHLSHLVNMENLQIGSDQTLENANGVQSWTHLKHFQVANTYTFSDSSDLENLTEVEEIILDTNEVKYDEEDFKGFRNKPNLRVIDMDLSNNMEINSMVNYIQNPDALEEFYCINCELPDISVLESFPNLKKVDVSYNQITDVTPLRNLSHLEYLDIGDNKIIDISSIVNLTPHLTYFGASGQDAYDTITVYSDDFVNYNLYRMDGSIEQIPLGVPTPGLNTYTISWSRLGSGSWPSSDKFSGNATIDVFYVPDPTLAIDKAQIEVNEESVPYTADQLKTLFGASSIASDLSTDLTSSIVVDSSKVDYSTPGTYPVIFKVMDPETHTQLSQVGNIVVKDILPKITTTTEEVEIELGSPITDYMSAFGTMASEIVNGDLTSSVTVDASLVNYEVTGSYPVTFSVSDEEGNTDTKTVTVTVKRQTFIGDPITPEINTLPVIQIDDNQEIDEENPLTDEQLMILFNATALDGEDGDLTSSITVDQSGVDYSTPGMYPVIFSVTDSASEQVSIQATLIVRDVLPVIETVNNNITVPVGTSAINYINEFGPTATEITTGDLNNELMKVDFLVNLNKTGTYPAMFTVKDEEGNIATKVVYVNVVRDTYTGDPITPQANVLPVIVKEDKKIILEESPKTDEEIMELFNVSALDAEDGEITNSVVVDQSKVNYSTPGSYPITFSVVDSYGNEVKEEVEIEIIDVLPTITTKTDEIEVEINTDIDYKEEFKPEATEITPGDLTNNITVDASQVNVNEVGEYIATFNVYDEEGNIATKEVKVKVQESAVLETGTNTVLGVMLLLLVLLTAVYVKRKQTSN